MRTSAGPDIDAYEVETYDAPRTPGGSIGRTQPLNRPAIPRQVQYGEEDHKAADQTAGLLQAAEVHGGHDALKLLYEAATVQGRQGRPAKRSRHTSKSEWYLASFDAFLEQPQAPMMMGQSCFLLQCWPIGHVRE